ncbi:ectopic P granules protein 5 homolog [Anabrus simplex]|uniref:ectopic P granules protein 5 homolog n=1 Tax=Anabrus simplex TaxID=316456 RepID=UPI0035A37FE7
MSEMEKCRPEQNKKKTRNVVDEGVLGAVPDAPKLEDFLSISSVSCSEDKTANRAHSDGRKCIEKEIKDAVEDDASISQEGASYIPSQKKEEEIIDIHNSDNALSTGLSPADIAIDVSSEDTNCFQDMQDTKNPTNRDKYSVGTELKEIHPYTSVANELLEADTRLASPRRDSDIVINKACRNEGSKPSAPERFHSEEQAYFSPTAPVIESSIRKDGLSVCVKQDDANHPSACGAQSKAGPSKLWRRVAEEFKPLTEIQLLSLYSNHELESNTEFVSEFVESQLQGVKQHHRLYELLVSYLRARNRLMVNTMELETLKKECNEHQSHLWTVETSIVSESGECQDGNPVSASHEYKVSHFNKVALAALTRSLTSIKDLVNEVQSLNSYSSEVLRLQIEHYVQNVAYSCPEFARLPHNAPVNLLPGEPPLHVIPHINELKTCIALLFTFQRRLVKDSQFVSDTRDWLARLVAVLLRVASWKDHLFVLNHVLRCPAGVGTWAASFVQAPPPVIVPANREQFELSPFATPHLDHMVAALATILLPIREREHFLEQVQTSLRESTSREPQPDSVWVLVDSEGEEDEDVSKSCWSILKENDLVSLLNQIPLDCMFRHVLLVERRDERDIYDITRVTENHVLRLFAFSTVLVRLLRQGLRTYDTPRYRQFAKRLGRLIRHTVQYASDQWECFSCNRWVDPAMLQRLQTEYDAFFLRATRCIFSSQRLGAWQFLAVIPYNVVSLHTLWRLFYLLHDDCQEEENLTNNSDYGYKLIDDQLRLQFEEKLTTMPEAESYYLLTTFANMAMARGPADKDFVREVTLDLFQIGFLSSATQESCSKTARVLLSNITSKHPTLLSDILAKLVDNFTQAGKLSLYLFKELPLRLWVPTHQDMSTISYWLRESPLMSTENHLARLILSNLNWGCSEEGLCLDQSLHRKVAVLVVDAALKYVPETLGSGGGTAIITESVKQVSSLATSMMRPQSNEQIFSSWTWEMATRLRLHVLDQPDHAIWTAMANPAAAFAGVPDLEGDSQWEVIIRGVRDKQPLACYVAVLMSIWGHAVPLICTKGFNALQILLCHYKYEAVIGVLQHVVPLFLDCEDSLVRNERFLSVLISVLMADKTYMKMAKNLIAPEFPGPVLKHMGNMIEYQLENSRRYSLQSPQPFVKLWMESLSQIPDWTKEQSVVYLMDIILRRAFFHNDARETASFVLNRLYQSVASPRHGNTLTNFISWVATGSAHTVSLLPRLSCAECPWFAYFVLEMEQEIQEEKTGLWGEVLKELAAATGKANVDQALKRAAHTLKLPVPSSSDLFIYRWAQQALDTPLDHQLLPLVWQKFFILFLARVPSASGVPDRGGVGDKFFEGMVNLSFLKKLKKRLQDAAEYYRSRSTEASDPNQSEEARDDLSEPGDTAAEKREWYTAGSKLLRTFTLWLEEPRLQEPSLFLPALPPQYDPNKLAVIIQGDRRPWLEYLDYPGVRAIQQTASWDWQVSRFRTQDPSIKVLFSSPEEANDPSERILRRLKSYDTPVPPPVLKSSKPVIPLIQNEMFFNRGLMLNGLKPSFRSLLEYAQIYSLRMSEHTALDCNFLELVPSLYRDVEMEILLHAACDTEPQTPRRGAIITCAGPAAIRLKVCEARVSEGTEHMIQQNRGEYETVLSRATQPPPQKVCIGSVFIEHTIALLENEFMDSRARNNMETALKLQDVGVTLFYHMISLYNEDAALYPPTKQLITGCLERLGQIFVSGDESQCMRLLTTIIQQPHMSGILGPHFTPAAASTPTFLQMYQTVVSIVGQQVPERIFVLLSKFDVARWLVSRRPRLSERSQFIELVGKAVTSAGMNPEDDKLILHEVFRKHLRLLLMYDFPEHYGEVLNLVLRSSETQSLSLDVWFDILNALLVGGETSQRRVRQGQNLGKVKEEICKYATEQKLLTHDELRETAALLGSHFMKERLQYGLYGLYPKYRVYIEPLTTFLGMVGHALVVSTLQNDRGTLSDKLCEQLWPSLCDMFSPWLAPYWTKNLKEPTAAWIQQLTDDRSVLLPWITADGPHAQKMVVMFVECIRFILDTLPACSNILCFVWQFYVSSFAHSAVKDYILNVVHGSFQSLPWERFWPSMQDLELMLKVVDQYLPDCHSFLGTVFIQVPWWSWVGHVLTAYPTALSARTHICLLHLLVKLANEPNVRQSSKAAPLLLEAQKFAWHLLDSAAYEPVINWCVMSCDPRVILNLEEDESSPTDVAVLELLQVVAAYVPTATHFHSTTLKKRQMFVRACVKLLLSCASRYKALLTKKEIAFRSAVHKLLDDVDPVVVASVPPQQQIAEAGLLLTEIMTAINQPAGSVIAALTVDSCVMWLNRRDCCCIVLLGFLRILGTSVTSPEALGSILEACLQAFFRQTVTQVEPPTWKHAVSILQPCVPRQPPVEDGLLASGHVLSLYALLLKRLPLCRDIREEGSVLANLVEWLVTIKPSETVEAKLPLLWSKVLSLSLRQCELSGDAAAAVKSLRKLVSILLQLADDRAGAGWGILGAIGLRKQSPVSVRCRLLSRAISVYVLAQLPDGDQTLVRTLPNSPGALASTNSPIRCSTPEGTVPIQQPRGMLCRRSNTPECALPTPSAEAIKALANLEALTTNKNYQELKNCIDLAVKYCVDPNNSLHNASQILGKLATELYQQQYLLGLKGL